MILLRHGSLFENGIFALQLSYRQYYLDRRMYGSQSGFLFCELIVSNCVKDLQTRTSHSSRVSLISFDRYLFVISLLCTADIWLFRLIRFWFWNFWKKYMITKSTLMKHWEGMKAWNFHVLVHVWFTATTRIDYILWYDSKMLIFSVSISQYHVCTHLRVYVPLL